jgi:ribosomal subunit interface protein
MQIPLIITFRHMEPSEALEAKIREKMEHLEKFHEHITSCRITIDQEHKRQNQGKLFSVKLDITLPGNEILITRHPDQHHAHEDVYVALRDTFDSARRKLEDHVRKLRGKVKVHETSPYGKIKQLFPYENYGVIETPDGREIYFHRNSVIDENFKNLTEGENVRFGEEMGDNGPQASAVHVERKHHVI